VVEISLLVEEVLGKNQKVVEDYKKGKTQSIGFLIGQVRKKAEGKADPKEVQKVLLEKLR
jgi:aspartyl-tRNA(Asn)/glutamyl-tRNA(Gln) amidotransferase subunit B